MSVSRFGRAQQWMQFHRQWHVIDASRQVTWKREFIQFVHFRTCSNLASESATTSQAIGNLFVTRKLTAETMSWLWTAKMWRCKGSLGSVYPIISTRFAIQWFVHQCSAFQGYPRSKVDIPAHQIHEYDPCRIMFMAVNSGMSSKLFRRLHLQRLHLFADEEMPDFIRRNISNQLEQVQTVPRKSDEYTPEERANFPRLVEYKDEHLLDWNNPQPTIETYIERRSR